MASSHIDTGRLVGKGHYSISPSQGSIGYRSRVPSDQPVRDNRTAERALVMFS